jgi:hypothetical protein
MDCTYNFYPFFTLPEEEAADFQEHYANKLHHQKLRNIYVGVHIQLVWTAQQLCVSVLLYCSFRLCVSR